MTASLLSAMPSPVLFRGDERVAYRDPAAVYADGRFHLFFTLVETEAPGEQPFLYTAVSTSRDLVQWERPRKLTPRDRALNFSSPGNVIRFADRWVMCLQTYCRPNGEKYGSADSRIWTMRSDDLRAWDEPSLLCVKGPQVPRGEMGRMIDPYLMEDRREAGKWWCLFKQDGISRAWSRDLERWTFAGRCDGGENVCVVHSGQEYVRFDSPENGIGVCRSEDLDHWSPRTLLTLGQQYWPWARGRLTAAFVLDARKVVGVESYLMFFHGSGPEDEQTVFDTYACIGLAWSGDLMNWRWPG